LALYGGLPDQDQRNRIGGFHRQPVTALT
jgi:hypothetical protein